MTATIHHATPTSMRPLSRRRPRGAADSPNSPYLRRWLGHQVAPRPAPEHRRGIPDRARPREGDTLTLALDAPAGPSGRGLVPGGVHGLDLIHHLSQLGKDRLVVQGLP